MWNRSAYLKTFFCCCWTQVSEFTTALFSKHLFELNIKYYIEENMKIIKMLRCFRLNVSSQYKPNWSWKGRAHYSSASLWTWNANLKINVENGYGLCYFKKYTGTNLIHEVETEEIWIHLFFFRLFVPRNPLKGKI